MKDIIAPLLHGPAAWICVAALGMVLGSFSTFLTYRFPRRLPVLPHRKKQGYSGARSVCPHCMTKLQPWHMVPILSWLWQRGRCHHCRTRIPAWYPISEAICTLLALLGFWRVGMGPELVIWLAASPLLTAMFVIDVQHKIIPDKINISLAILGIIYVATTPLPLAGQIVSCAVYGGFSWLLRNLAALALKKEALGLGDVKFFFVVGLWIPLPLFSIFLFISGVGGILIALLMRFQTNDPQIPFGPALELAFITCILWQAEILSFVKSPIVLL